ncbi:hypothetical protein DMN91_010734 [Ooceraea biroi]|uniref:Pseudouridylate synthase 7-like protein n=1 Tax=Ooceraea biroi TaxID=2015173 RepID=A0A026X2Q7_OOCBI|nr:pseudouridylate synthase 7 homolog [Ooceraea biroi]EZA62378.1 Pseudouridylate synthase 7-like protein [Ooceraea biroi]RLU16666.1 hypothetical protein DMN91_010734 [Ooceraea biroi]
MLADNTDVANSTEKNQTQKDKRRHNWKTGQKGEVRGKYFNKSGFKRKFEQPQGNAKKKKLSVGLRLKESDIGIAEHIGKHKRFCAILKERFTDFHVNEIDLDGQVAKLIHQDIPPVPDDTETIDDLKECIAPVVWEQLQALKEATFTQLDVDVTVLQKGERRTIHAAAKKLANVVSQTVDEGDKKFIRIVATAKIPDSGCKVRRSNREDWTKRGGDYCHFLLHKVNKDTNDAVNQLAVKLRMRPDNFGYAGMKDRRAWTTQRVSLRKVDACSVLNAARNVHGVYVGNFRYAKSSLKLGMLRGNQFRIALRNASGTDEEIERAMTSLRDNGFINYYGLQRFGTVASIPTHEIGKHLLQGKWNAAIELILRPRPGEGDSELTEARQIYADTKDPQAAYAKIKRLDKLEARLLKGLQVSGDNNPQGALDFIPRNIRLMYVHAYQSLVWNHIVSRRIKEFGTNVIVGDLVYDERDCKKDAETDEITDDCLLHDNDDIKDETDEKDDDLPASKASEDNSKQQGPRGFPTVKILTEEDLPSYTLVDVVMPQPGWKVTYPPYAKAWYDEFLSKDDLPTNLKQKNKKFSLTGTYRKILEIPTNLSWKIMHYKEWNDNLILSDIDEIRKHVSPQDEPDGKFKALIIEMCLKSSSYATMALREILENDTSAETQAGLSASHDAENVSDTNTTDESSNSSSKDANSGKDNAEKNPAEFGEKSTDVEKDDEMESVLKI